MLAKPSDAEIERRRAEKQQLAKSKPKKEPQKKKERDPEAEKAALKDWALGVSCVDIGANLQSRGSFAEIQRQIERAKFAKVDLVVLTGCDIEGSKKGKEACEAWAAKNDDQRILFTAGVHPHSAKEWSQETETQIRNLAASPYLASLGECGLDYDRMLSPREVQLDAFRAQCFLAKDLNRPLFVHCREKDEGPPLGAYDDAVRILREAQLDPNDVCVHCFTGTESELRTVLDFGAYVGFTGFIGIKKRNADTLTALKNLRFHHGDLLDRLMIETDSPFMSPDKFYLPTSASKQLGIRGGKNEPAVLPAVARALADALNTAAAENDDAYRVVTPDDVATVTTKNAYAFFRLPRPDHFRLADDDS